MRHTATDKLPAIHPGDILADELEALGLSARKFADHIGVPPNAVTAILHGDRSVTAEMAMRLGKAFGTGELFWINLQSHYDAKIAREKMRDKIAAIEPLVAGRGTG
jgi:addiction module HigA family antidote